MTLACELVIIARYLRDQGKDVMAEAAAQAAKVLAGPTCIDCGGSVLGGRSSRCASCRHAYRQRYYAARYAARKGRAA